MESGNLFADLRRAGAATGGPLLAVLWLSGWGCGSEHHPPSSDAGADGATDAGHDRRLDAALEPALDAAVDASYEDCLGRCTQGLQCCDDAFGAGVRGCVDTQLDTHNCGGCGVTCRPDEQCLSGSCGCPSAECRGRCVDLAWDPDNCGACGASCGGNLPICFLASCRTCEGTGGMPCGEECPRVLEDEQQCGGCGQPCGENEACVGGSCVGGSCDAECPEDWVCCDNAWGWGAPGCSSIEWDGVNCGACGVACADGSTCVRGLCVPQDCDAGCGFGQTCCETPWGALAAGCTTVEWDPANCGACGNVCERGTVCASGTCREP